MEDILKTTSGAEKLSIRLGTNDWLALNNSHQEKHTSVLNLHSIFILKFYKWGHSYFTYAYSKGEFLLATTSFPTP